LKVETKQLELKKKKRMIGTLLKNTALTAIKKLTYNVTTLKKDEKPSNIRTLITLYLFAAVVADSSPNGRKHVELWSLIHHICQVLSGSVHEHKRLIHWFDIPASILPCRH
jgi:hypothetical protein